jgi:hypothetical protein
VTSAESLCGALERRLIQALVLAIARSTLKEERQRLLFALRDLLAFADPTLDATRLDPWTRAFLARTDPPPETTPRSHQPIALHQGATND